MSAHAAHVPVMLPRCSACSRPRDGGIYLDGTFGGGGYAAAILEAAPCTVWAIDRDPDAIARGASLAARFPGRLHLIHGQFGDMLDLLARARRHRAGRRGAGPRRVVVPARRSGARLLVPRRRPARHAHGPQRADRGRPGQHAAGARAGRRAVRIRRGARLAPHRPRHRRRARRGADRHHRAGSPRSSAACCRRTAPASIPATRSFQALRIRVNDELGEIERALEQAAPPAGARRAAGRGVVPFAGGPHRQALHDRGGRPRAGAVAPRSARPCRPPRAALPPAHRAAAASGRRRDRRQSPRPQRPAARARESHAGGEPRHDPALHLRLLPAGLRLGSVSLSGQAPRADARPGDREDHPCHRGTARADAGAACRVDAAERPAAAAGAGRPVPRPEDGHARASSPAWRTSTAACRPYGRQSRRRQTRCRFRSPRDRRPRRRRRSPSRRRQSRRWRWLPSRRRGRPSTSRHRRVRPPKRRRAPSSPRLAPSNAGGRPVGRHPGRPRSIVAASASVPAALPHPRRCQPWVRRSGWPAARRRRRARCR